MGFSRRIRIASSGVVVGLLAAGASVATAPAAHAATFTSGDLVVLQVGTGSTLSSAAAPLTLDEFATSGGAAVQNIALPTADSGGGQFALTESGSAGSEGALNLSSDGHYLAVAGYDATPGTAGVASSATIGRVVGLIDGSGNVDTSTRLTNTSQANNFRSAVTSNGTDIWTGGAGGQSGNVDGGVRYTTKGSTTSTAIVPTGTFSNGRVVEIQNGQLYTSTQKAPIGIDKVGTGLPTTTGQSISSVVSAGVPGDPYAFAFVDRDSSVSGPDTLYVADQTSGLLKYSFDGTSWTA
ncbi:MAG TPA: DUF3616 domain-containing protein, partial [Acidimicrobiia bacterium]